jgi:hypothetical protein
MLAERLSDDDDAAGASRACVRVRALRRCWRHGGAGLFAALPRLRQSASSVWRHADVNAQIAGWSRYSAVQLARGLSKEQLAQLALVERPQAMLPPVADASTAAVAAAPKITVLAMGRAPLAEPQLPAGGLIRNCCAAA